MGSEEELLDLGYEDLHIWLIGVTTHTNTLRACAVSFSVYQGRAVFAIVMMMESMIVLGIDCSCGPSFIFYLIPEIGESYLLGTGISFPSQHHDTYQLPSVSRLP